jgi:thiamine-phosphate pyrophosphorylase
VTAPRLFLAAPEGIAAPQLLACLKAACGAGDVASLLVPAALAKDLTAAAQAMGVAVIIQGEPRHEARSGADGVQVEAAAAEVSAARESIGKDRIAGAYAGSSRHFAMEAAEAGADYIAFDQNGPALGGEPIIRWWSDMMQIPCVAFTPVDPDDLDILLPQKPDFIRPSDAMWRDEDHARAIVSALSQRLGPS